MGPLVSLTAEFPPQGPAMSHLAPIPKEAASHMLAQATLGTVHASNLPAGERLRIYLPSRLFCAPPSTARRRPAQRDGAPATETTPLGHRQWEKDLPARPS